MSQSMAPRARRPARERGAFTGAASLSLVTALLVALVLFGTGASTPEAASAGEPSSPPTAPALQAATVRSASPTATPPIPEIPEAPEPGAHAQPTDVFASVGAVDLHLPSAEVVLTGFHQASTPGSHAMSPAAGHRVLPSRGRGYPATSAVDIVMVDDQRVRSPVSGRVMVVERYTLYGRHPDRRIVIRPHDDPRLRVVMLHVHGVMVEAGDEVEAGVTEIGKRARRFPFRSQVDKETAPDAWPHVHYEVKG